MTRRILTRDEYPRLVGTYLEPLIAVLPPDADVIVVEDAEGRIVGCSSIFARDHVECTWIAEDHRNTPDVFWSLLRGIKAQARQRGSLRVLTASMDERMTAFLHHVAVPLPGEHFVWPLVKES